MVKIKIVVDFFVGLIEVEIKEYDIMIIFLFVMIDGMVYVECEMIINDQFFDMMEKVSFLLKIFQLLIGKFIEVFD